MLLLFYQQRKFTSSADLCKGDHLLLSNVENMRGSAKCLGCNSVLVLNER